MTEQIDYVRLLPKLPEEDIVGFAREQGAFHKNYLIYRHSRKYSSFENRMQDCVKVVCSNCGESFYATKRVVDCGRTRRRKKPFSADRKPSVPPASASPKPSTSVRCGPTAAKSWKTNGFPS